MVRIVLQSLKIVTIALTAVLVVAGGARAFADYLDKQQPNDIGRRFSFTVSEDDTVSAVAKRLHDKGLVRFEFYFENRIRVVNADLVPGKYQLKKGMSVAQMVDILTGKLDPNATNETASNEREEEEQDEEEADTFEITVIEGWRTEQIAEKLVELGWNGSVDEFMKAVEEFPVENYEFLESRNNPFKPNSLEGFLFPAKYEVLTDEPAQDIIQKMLDHFDEQFTPEMRQRTQEMNLSIYDVLIYASLIEREAQVADERPIIADVFLNRFEQGINMDSDPTVRYAIGKEEGGDWWDAPSGEQLENTDSPYNTYKNQLPPGPICNPSLDSIKAVLTGGGTEYLYFVAIGDDSGRHLFAFDEFGQQQNVDYLDGNAAEPAPNSDPFASAQVVDQGGGEVPAGSEGGEEIPIESTDG